MPTPFPYSQHAVTRTDFSFVCVLSLFSSQLIVNFNRRTLFLGSDHISTSGRLYVWARCTGNCKDVIRSTETFKSLAPLWIFMLGVIYFFFARHSLSLWNWIFWFPGCLEPFICCLTLGFLSDLWSPLIFYYVATWSDCRHAESTWRKVPRLFLHEKQRSVSVYPHIFRFVAFGRRIKEWIFLPSTEQKPPNISLLMRLVKKKNSWLVGWLVLRYINPCRLFDAKSCLYIYILNIYDL